MPKAIVIAAFYAFKEHEQLEIIREELLQICTTSEIKGTIIIAEEGINSTIAGSREAIDVLKDFLINKLLLDEEIEYKESFADNAPFRKLKVKIKDEIITFGEKLTKSQQKGKYLNSYEWEEIIESPDTIIIDTRNDYEITDIGTFNNAINPRTNKFSDIKSWLKQQLPAWKDKKIAMFCTGGIRCEKSTAYMHSLGANQVYHLKGGILRYLEETQNHKNLWQGKCFIFDDRRMLDEKLEQDA